MIVDAAEKWFMPPWKLGGGTRTLWYARMEVLREVTHKAHERERRKAEAMRKQK